MEEHYPLVPTHFLSNGLTVQRGHVGQWQCIRFLVLKHTWSWPCLGPPPPNIGPDNLDGHGHWPLWLRQGFTWEIPSSPDCSKLCQVDNKSWSQKCPGLCPPSLCFLSNIRQTLSPLPPDLLLLHTVPLVQCLASQWVRKRVLGTQKPKQIL